MDSPFNVRVNVSKPIVRASDVLLPSLQVQAVAYGEFRSESSFYSQNDKDLALFVRGSKLLAGAQIEVRDTSKGGKWAALQVDTANNAKDGFTLRWDKEALASYSPGDVLQFRQRVGRSVSKPVNVALPVTRTSVQTGGSTFTIQKGPGRFPDEGELLNPKKDKTPPYIDRSQWTFDITDDGVRLTIPDGAIEAQSTLKVIPLADSVEPQDIPVPDASLSTVKLSSDPSIALNLVVSDVNNNATVVGVLDPVELSSSPLPKSDRG